MGRIVITEFVSVDGVMDEPRWTFDFDRGAEGDNFKLAELFGADAMLLGRVTYQAFAQAWPGRTDEEGFADRMNSLPKYVISQTLADADATWQGTTVLRGDVLTETKALRDRTERDVLIHGSAMLAHTLISAGLFDELHLMVFPIMLGCGLRAFPDDKMQSKLTLASSSAINDGIVLLTYQPR
jgi:dihydrofolate reductase